MPKKLKIESFKNDIGVVEIRHPAERIYYVVPTTFSQGSTSNRHMLEQIAAGLAWWREQHPSLQILSTAGFDGDDESAPSLLIITA